MTESLGRRLGRHVALPYVIVFVLVLAIFAGAVHVVAGTLYRRALTAELEALASAASALAEFEHGRLTVADGAGGIMPPGGAMEWYDGGGRRIGRRGSFSPAASPLVPDAGIHWSRESVVSLARPVGADGRTVGYVRVSISDERAERSMQWIDAGLVIGLLLAAVTSAVGGWYLSRRSVRQIASTVHALEEFTANAAHELRGPVTAVRVNAEASLRGGLLTEKDRVRLATVVGATESMQRLIDDLLLLATADGMRESEPHLVDLDEVVQSVVAERREDAVQRGVTITVHVEGKPCTRGNALHIARVVSNLLDNAVRHSPPGASVDVRTWQDHATSCVAIRDRGPGIAHSHVPHLFERFWRGDPARGPGAGSGLGLAIVESLVKRHRGSVAVSTAPHAGSTFTVTLPAGG